MSKDDLSVHVTAHEQSIRPRASIRESEQCGCFYCLATYAPTAIDAWVNHRLDCDVLLLSGRSHESTMQPAGESVGSSTAIPIVRVAEFARDAFELRALGIPRGRPPRRRSSSTG